MPNLEWEVPHTLTTPLGSLNLNVIDGSGHKYQVQPDYSIVPTLRVTQDGISQADGSVLHPRWKTGLVATLTVHYLQNVAADGINYEPACGAVLRQMHDALMLQLNALRELTGTQRLLWLPTGYSTGGGLERMIDDIQLLTWADPVRDTTETGVTFQLETPFPYAIDSVQTTTHIAASGSTTLTNSGTADFLPVMKVFGPATAFTIYNVTTGLQFVYNSTRPGGVAIAGGHYAEIDFFRGTITLDGNVSFLDAGIDPLQTTFFPLVHGANIIQLDAGAAGGVDVLWNLSWS